MNVDRTHTYRFGPFQLDPRQRLLLRDGQPVPLQPKAFETLLVLVQNTGQVVSKEDLLKAVWPDTFVEESNLTQNISVLRKALGGTPGGHRYIVTTPGLGYRFTLPVQTMDPAEAIVVPEVEPAKNDSSRIASPGPRGFSSIRWFVAAGALIILIGGWLSRRSISPRRAERSGRVMLAVLPFQNLSGDPEQEYFADGLTEEMITQLGRMQPEQLGVIARTSVMPYKHTEKRIDQIGRELSIQYVLEGSFRRSTDHLRVTAQLIQVKDQSHLWAEEYDRRPDDLVLVQDDVAAAVAKQIQLRLQPQPQARLARAHRADPAVYEEFLKGRYFFNQRSAEGLQKAIAHFELAIRRDPDYGQAYAAMAAAYGGLAYYGLGAPNEVLPRANSAARKALALDDQLSDAYASLALVAELYDRNWPEAERNYQQAIRLNPNDAAVHSYYSSAYLSVVGRFDEALAELAVAHQLDSAVAHHYHGSGRHSGDHRKVGRVDGAISEDF